MAQPSVRFMNSPTSVCVRVRVCLQHCVFISGGALLFTLIDGIFALDVACGWLLAVNGGAEESSS